MKAALIVNPVAGQGKAKKNLLTIKEKFKKSGYEIYTYQTKGEKDAVKAARQAITFKPDVIVAVGGDGTVSEVINGMVGSNIPLGIVPCGTTNVLATELNIPKSIVASIEVILQKKKRLIDLGTADETFFVLMAGIGFDAQVVSDIKPEVKNLLKNLAYVVAGARALLNYKPVSMEVTLDERMTRKGSFVVIGNARSYAGKYTITTDARIDDGWLDVCIFTGNTISDFMKYVTGVLTKSHVSYSDVEYFKVKKVFIRSTPPVFVQCDGELRGKTPMSFGITPKSLSVFSP